MQGFVTITWNDAYTSFCMLSGTSNNKVLKISLMILFYNYKILIGKMILCWFYYMKKYLGFTKKIPNYICIFLLKPTGKFPFFKW